MIAARTRSLLAALSVLLGAGSIVSVYAVIRERPALTEPKKIGRYLVKYRRGVRAGAMGKGNQAAAVQSFMGDSQLRSIQLDNTLSDVENVNQLKQDPNVLYADVDHEVQIQAIPDDPLYPTQWAPPKIAAPQAWDLQTDASSVVVAVIDTGIDFNHPDLQANLWTDPTDGSHGWDCFTKTPGGQDDHGHGTAIAGIIGAAGNNTQGIAGLNWNAKLIALKALNASGFGTDTSVINCLDHAIFLKQTQNINIRLTNNSYAWQNGAPSPAVEDAYLRAYAAGILEVTGPANNASNIDVFPIAPSSFGSRGIVSAGATDNSDTRAGFSNYGLASVDIGAPGAGIVTTVPTGSCALCDSSGYRSVDGTSVATPQVTGVLAALLARFPALPIDKARDMVLDPASYDPLGNTSFSDQTTTGGRLNFYKTITNPKLPNPPLNGFPDFTSAPTSPLTVTGGNAVNLSAAVTDPDGDPLRMLWNAARDPADAIFQRAVFSHLPTQIAGNTLAFTSPAVSRTVMIPYAFAAADGRGGSILKTTYINILPTAAAAEQTLTGNLQLTPSGPVALNGTVQNYFPVTSSAGSSIYWDAYMISPKPYVNIRNYDLTPGDTATFTVGNAPGIYTFRAHAMDEQANMLIDRREVSVGGAVGRAPVALMTASQLSGPIMTVEYNFAYSYDPDGALQEFSVLCGDGRPAARGGPGPNPERRASCTYYTPGMYTAQLIVRDNSGYGDATYRFVTVGSGTVTEAGNQAQFAYQSLPGQQSWQPATLKPGESFHAYLGFRNSGTQTWTPGATYQLRWKNLDGTVSLAPLDPTDTVRPGDYKFFDLIATAPMAPGTYEFQARMAQNGQEFGDYNLKARIQVANNAVSIVRSAYAYSNPTLNDYATIEVYGDAPGGESSLTYTWAAIGSTNPVTFTANGSNTDINGTNAASTSVAHFSQPGFYHLQATVRDPLANTATSDVFVTVQQSVRTLDVAPSTAVVSANQTRQFNAQVLDQFGHAMSLPACSYWTVSGGGSMIYGLFTAGAMPGGPFTVTLNCPWSCCEYGWMTGSASVIVNAAVTACNANFDSQVNILDVQLTVNEALGAAPCTADVNNDGSCNNQDVQQVVNSALGGSCAAP